ncbi:MAG: hypothetical protein VX278_04945, partial [Myxococcota bacterium]|nr:hypothetical protein [Myxococcota bacterium]
MLIFLLPLVWSAQIVGAQIINKRDHLRLILDSDSVISQNHLEFSVTEKKAVLYVPGQQTKEELLND